MRLRKYATVSCKISSLCRLSEWLFCAQLGTRMRRASNCSLILMRRRRSMSLCDILRALRRCSAVITTALLLDLVTLLGWSTSPFGRMVRTMKTRIERIDNDLAMMGNKTFTNNIVLYLYAPKLIDLSPWILAQCPCGS